MTTWRSDTQSPRGRYPAALNNNVNRPSYSERNSSPQTNDYAEKKKVSSIYDVIDNHNDENTNKRTDDDKIFNQYGYGNNNRYHNDNSNYGNYQNNVQHLPPVKNTYQVIRSRNSDRPSQFDRYDRDTITTRYETYEQYDDFYPNTQYVQRPRKNSNYNSSPYHVEVDISRNTPAPRVPAPVIDLSRFQNRYQNSQRKKSIYDDQQYQKTNTYRKMNHHRDYDEDDEVDNEKQNIILHLNFFPKDDVSNTYRG